MANNSRLSNNRLYLHILKHDKLTPQEKFVALSIAGHRNEQTLKCCPTQLQISNITGIADRHKLSRIINALKRKSILGTIRLVDLERPFRCPNQYYFTIDLEQAQTISDNESFEGDHDSLNLYAIKHKAHMVKTNKHRPSAATNAHKQKKC